MTLGNIRIVKLVSGKWKHLLIIAIIAAVAGVVVSMPFIMKPRYKSEAVVYPSNLGPYSLESPTEQLMQLLESRKLKARVLQDQKLDEHYKLDRKDPLFDFYYPAVFDEHVKFSQTRFESVIITVVDENPEKAQQINNSILTQLDAMVKEIHDEKTREFLLMYENQMQYKKRRVDSLNNVMNTYRSQYNIMDYAVQVKEATRSYYQALSQGKSRQSLAELKAEMDLLKQHGGQYLVMDKLLHETVIGFEQAKKEYDDRVRDLKKKFTYTTVVADPYKPVKKTWPVRWLVVLTFVCSAIFMALVWYLIADRFKKEAIL